MNRLLSVLMLSVSTGIYAAEDTDLSLASHSKRKAPDTPDAESIFSPPESASACPSKKARLSPKELPRAHPVSLSPAQPTLDINSLLPFLLPQPASSTPSLSPASPTPQAININSLLASLFSPPVQIPAALSLLNPSLAAITSIDAAIQRSHSQILMMIGENMHQLKKQFEALEKEKESKRIESETKEQAAQVQSEECTKKFQAQIEELAKRIKTLEEAAKTKDQPMNYLKE